MAITLVDMTAKTTLARVVNPKRANLIKWFSYQFDGSSTQAAECLTNIAIERKYITYRSAPPGESLKHWVKAKKAPQWACRAAFDYLIDNDWQPNDELSKAIAARYLLLNGHRITQEWEYLIGPWFDIALEANKEM
ncbi:hypothetical protein [Vibrio apostichopi]|uniref:hypothetical protein n=1 Tax=Vibrio apostichopi TaxID=3035453 RepID=UPI0025739AF1|nr:hypothetical protein [Vibrio sp. FE10]